MTHESEWDAVRGRRLPALGIAGMSALRAALLFGSAGVALALILSPIADRYSKVSNRLDYTATGSIGQGERYTIRRSVLQKTGSACIIRADGRRSGDC